MPMHIWDVERPNRRQIGLQHSQWCQTIVRLPATIDAHNDLHHRDDVGLRQVRSYSCQVVAEVTGVQPLIFAGKLKRTKTIALGKGDLLACGPPVAGKKAPVDPDL